MAKQECPDFLLEAEDGTCLGLEVTHLYYDSQEAKMILGRSSDGLHGVECFAHSVDALNKLLKKKGELGRSYQRSYPVSLLVRVASPIFDSSAFENSKHLLEIPKDVYQDVWLLAREHQNSQWHLISLYSENDPLRREVC